MQREPAARDCGGDRIAAASISKLRVDDGDRQLPGVIGLDRVRQLKELFLGGLGLANGRSCLNFILDASPCRWRRRDASRLYGLGASGTLLYNFKAVGGQFQKVWPWRRASCVQAESIDSPNANHHPPRGTW